MNCLIISGKSDVGKCRSSNQDRFDITEISVNYYLCTVCDGMGGVNGGNIASETAISVFKDYVKKHFDENNLDISKLLNNAVAAANKAVFDRAQEDESIKGMGTTLVSLLLCPDGKAFAVNVGDSRLYTVDQTGIRQITKDHSYVQYLIDKGKLTVNEAKNSSVKNIIIRSIGNESTANPDIFSLTFSVGNYFLLCSDGLSNCVGTEQIKEAVIPASSQKEMDACVDNLVNLANNNGGTDNITVIVGKLD